MTLTDAILIIIALLLWARYWQAHDHHQALVKWLDATAEMLADQLHSIIENGKGKQ
jgi:hypothetical protein